MTDWTCHVLNTYLRYFDLTQAGTVLDAVEQHLTKHSATAAVALTVSDLYLVVGDFTGTTTDADSDRLLRSTQHKRKENRRRSSTKTTSLLDLESLGFHSICPSNATSSAHESTADTAADDLSQKTASKSKHQMITASSCNILCHDRMPSTSNRSAFREALYRNKSPFGLKDDLALDDSSAKEAAATRLCGYFGVVRQGLCHMAIPRGFTWGGAASEHCPVWVEMYKQDNRTRPLDPPLNGSVATIDNLNMSSLSAASLDARAKRQLFQQRRNSLKSNGSFTRLMNGSLVPMVATNGDVNVSSDSVFVNGI